MQNNIPKFEDGVPVDNVPRFEDGVPVEDAFSVKQLSGIQESFTTPNRLAWMNKDRQAQFGFELKDFDDPELEEKKWAVSAFHSKLMKEDIRFCYHNLDEINRAFYGKETSVDKAFEEIKNFFTPDENSPHWEAFKQGAYELGLKLDGLALGATRLAAYQYKPYFSLFGLDDKYDAFQKFLGDIEDGMRSQARVERQIAANKIKANPDFITDIFTGDFDKVSLSDFTKTLAMAVPDQAFQLFLASLPGGRVTLPAYVGITTMQEKEFDVRKDHPEWGAAKKWSYIALNGLNEALFEVVTAKIIGKAIKPEQGAEIIKQGLIKFLGKSFLKEGGTEAAQQFDSNVFDILYDVKGDRAALSGAEITRRLFSGVLEEFAVGGTFGTGFGFAGWSNARKVASVYSEIRKRNQDEVTLLSKKENRTPAEENRLSRAKAILDTADPVSAIRADHINRTVNAQEEAGEIINSQEYKTLLENYPDLSEEDAFRVVADKRKLDVLAAAEYSIEDLAAEVEDFSKTVKNLTFHVIEDMSSAPQEVQKTKESRNYGNIPAFWHNGETYINAASKIAPHEVRKFLLHEVVGHEGIRRVVPENQLNSMLDNLFAEHSDDQEFAELAGRYFRGKVSTTEDGEITYDLTLDEQREAAEEYIAYIAQRDVKPSWWKQFIQAVRTFFKGFYSLDMSDSDIETLIGRAAAKTRRRAWSRHSSEVVTDLSDGNGLERTGTDGNGLEQTETDGRARFLVDEEGTDIEQVNIKFNEGIDRQIAGNLPNGYIYQLGTPGNILLSTGIPNLPIELSASHLNKKANQENHPFNIEDIKNLPLMLQNPIGVFLYGDKEKAQNIIVEIEKDGKNFLVGLSLNYNRTGIDVNSIRGLFPKDLHEWLLWIQQNKALYLNKEKVQNLITQQQINLADVSYLDLNSINNIIENFKNPSLETKKNTRFSVAPDIDTPAFKNWFAESKVVNEDGKPMVVYHGSSALFWVFDHHFSMQNGAVEGRGFYFTRDKNKAAGYKTKNGKLFEVYLRLQKPLSPDELTITKAELEKIIRAVDTNGDYVANYATDGIGYPGKTWYNKAVHRTVNAIYDSSDNNADIVAEIYIMFGQGDALAKITEATGYDGFIKDDVYVVFNPTQIKSATDNVGTFDPNNPDIRFAVAPEETEWEKAVISVLRPVVGESVELSKEEIAAKVKELYGLDLSPDDANLYAYLAAAENRHDNASRQIAANKKRAFEHLEDVNTYFYFFRQSGENQTINPGKEYEGQEVSGSFISENFRKYSVKRPQGKKESDKAYRRYLERRRKKLDSADGINLTDLAQNYTRMYGGDPLTVADEMFDFFKDLQTKQIISDYKKYKQDLLAFEKSEDERMKAEFLAQEAEQIKDEAAEILEAGRTITFEWIQQNKKVYKELYRTLFGKEAPSSVNPDDVEVINAALQQKGPASDFARNYREAINTGRQQAWEKYQEKLKKLRESVAEAKADTIKLQKEALAFAQENLPPEKQSDFVKRIVGLLEFSSQKNEKYPQGHRDYEFRKLMRELTEASENARRSRAIDSIRETLDNYRMRRTVKGIPVSKLPAVQNEVNEIASIFRMSPGSLAVYRGRLIAQMAQAGDEDSPLYIEARRKAALADMFGDLSSKSPDAANNALKYLEHLTTTGKEKFKSKMAQRLEKIKDMRKKVIANLSGSTIDLRGKDAKLFNSEYLRNRATLESLLLLTMGGNISNFENSVQADLVVEYEAAQERERTANRLFDRDVRQAVKDILGYEKAFGWQKFIDEINAPVKNSGVFKILYTSKDKKEGYSLVNRRPASRTKVNWKIAQQVLGEHGDAVNGIYHITSKDGVRSALKNEIDLKDDFAIFSVGDRNILYTIDYDTGAITSSDVGKLAYMRNELQFRPVDGVSRRFATRQTEDAAAGVQPMFEEFASNEEDTVYQALNEQEKNGIEVEFIAPFEVETQREELQDLTINRALQLILEYEQAQYKDTFEWNGYTKETMDALYNFVGEKYLKFGYWMRDYIAQSSAKLDALAKEKYGVGLPHIENYWMGAFQGTNQKIKEDNGIFAGAGKMSMNPAFLIARRGHLKPPDTQADAFSMFLRHVTEQIHFVENSSVVADLAAVFNSSKVTTAINTTLGKNLTDEIQKRIGYYAAGGGTDGKGGALLAVLSRGWAASKIMFSAPSMVKQYLGGLAFAYNMPVKEFWQYSSKALTFQQDFKDFARKAWESDFMQNRFAGGLDKDLVYLLNYTVDSDKFNAVFNSLVEFGTLGTRAADVASSIQWGYAVYAYTRDQALKLGCDKAEAEKRAWLAWQKSVNETQQSSNITSQNYYMANNSIYRPFTAFRSNTIQTMDLVLRSIDEIKLGGMSKSARKKLARQLFISHGVIPVSMWVVTQAFRHGFDVEEWELEDLALSMLFGSFEGLLAAYFLKDVCERIVNTVLGKSILRSSSGSSTVPVVDEGLAAVERLIRLADDDDVTASDFAAGFKALGDILMAGGTVYAPASALGSVMSALGMRTRQLVRLFEDK